MFLAPASLASIMPVIRSIRVIRIIARGRVWRIIYSVLTTLFLIFTFLPFLFWIWRRRMWRIIWRRIRVWGHIWFMNSFDSSRNIKDRFRLSRFYLSRNIEIGSDRVFSIRVGMFSRAPKCSSSPKFWSSPKFCLSVRVKSISTFSPVLLSRSNICIVSKSKSLRNFSIR